MALNIKNLEVERLAAELATLTGESKTEAIRQALELRLRQLTPVSRRAQKDRFYNWLETEIWPSLPPEALRPMTKEEEAEILGYGPDGYCVP